MITLAAEVKDRRVEGQEHTEDRRLLGHPGHHDQRVGGGMGGEGGWTPGKER